MLLAVRCRPGARDVETRSTRAGVMQATSGNDVHHAVLSMLLTERYLLDSLEVHRRYPRARLM